MHNKLKEIECRLQQISDQISALQVEYHHLNQEKQNLVSDMNKTHNQNVLSIEDRLYLFSQRFIGRVDTFAYRWESKTGKSGYAVACANEWKSGICNKPKIKCTDCKHRQLLPLTQEILYSHLIGQKVIGIYPLLLNDQCRFLAIDFDKSDWQNCITACSKVCSSLHIPFLVERSRSGNGAHIWIFFSESIQAQKARLMGTAILNKAMELYPALDFDSYDRMFPNQDYIPAGGFGNLIALPLQKQARAMGNSTFIDRDFNAFSDPWSILQQIQLMNTMDVENIANELANMINGHNIIKTENVAPWLHSFPPIKQKISGCPKSIEFVLANMIHIPIQALPSQLIAQLKRLATFSNPRFFKAQAMRFSTMGIPRHICCARLEGEYLSLPRGCLSEAINLLKHQSISINLNDQRTKGNILPNIHLHVKLHPEQEAACTKILEHNVGILYAPTGFGKTVIATAVITKRKTNTLILVHNKELVDQWKARLISFLPEIEVGTIQGGKMRLSNQIDIATYQSLINRVNNSIKPITFNYGQVIVDECHHLSAPSYEFLLSEISPLYVLGLTATPERQDGHQPIVFMQAGSIVYKAKFNNNVFLKKVLVKKDYDGEFPERFFDKESKLHISHLMQHLVEDEKRNIAIINDVSQCILKGRFPLILTERKIHAEKIRNKLEHLGYKTSILQGGMSQKQNFKEKQNLHDTQVVVATGKYIGEGFDLPRLDTLFLAMPISWKGALAQYVGRIHRANEGKFEVQVYDYVDVNHPIFVKMFQRRSKGYKSLGYI
ncbi:TOTE conflict system archaeo-eukaryotic primase domain-containing protein [Acinetobacter puyangensis]|uniref:TOTE conflict system archaeo-eukaryotic primase domain-containing protein n=1 Tax=Acinetobacter puyangensis TaxID=1096779 RepID=UPI003A4D614B